MSRPTAAESFAQRLYGGNKVAVNAIGPDGVVRRGAADRADGAECALQSCDPSNRYVLHTSLGGDLVYQEKFDARTGKLTPKNPPSIAQDEQVRSGSRR